jgi:hypothetical protein
MFSEGEVPMADDASKEGNSEPSSLSSPPSQLQPPPHATEKLCHCGYKPSPWWKDWLEGIALIAGISYAIVTFCMWRDAHDDFIVNQRAWIGVDRPISVESLTGDITKCIVTIKNFGNSVALNVGISAKAIGAWDQMKPASETACKEATNVSRIYKTKVQSNFGELPKEMSTGVMFPGEVSGHHFTGTIQKGIAESPLTVVGCLVYRDQFDKERRSRFCYQAEDTENAFPRLIYQCPFGVNDAN